MDRYVLEIDEEMRFTVTIGEAGTAPAFPSPIGTLTPHLSGITGKTGQMVTIETEE